MREIYNSVGNLQKMNSLIAEASALVRVDPDVTEEYKYEYQTLNRAARLYAQHEQYQQLRSLIDTIDSQYVRETMMVEASAFLHEDKSPAERAAIARLFPEFDMTALVAQLSESFSAPSQRFENPIYDYRTQLRNAEKENISSTFSSSLDAFIAEQRAAIEQFSEPLVQAVAYRVLGEFLSYYDQQRAAMNLFEESLQRFNDSADEQSLARVSYLDLSKEVYPLEIQELTGRALIRSGDFEQGYRLIKAADSQNENTTLAQIIRRQIRFSFFAGSQTFSLPRERRLALLSEARSLVPQLGDKEKQLDALISISAEYLAMDEAALARQLAPSVMDTFMAIAPGPYSDVSNYAEFLISIGEHEQAIALSIAREDDTYLQEVLPAQLVAAGEYELAEELRESLPISIYRLFAGRRMAARYQSLGLLAEALELTKRLLSEAQNVDLEAEKQAGVPGYWRVEITDVIGERINRVGDVLKLYSPSYSNIHYMHLSPEEVNAIGIELARTIDSDWLRNAVIEEALATEAGISAFESDPDLEVPDSLRLRQVLELVDQADFQTAASAADKIQSPYIQVRALAHIGASYLP